MKIAILDDYQNAVKDLNCFQWLKDYDVTILTETEKNTILLAEKLKNIEILVLIRERTQINEDLLSKLPDLKLISQTGKIANHLDLPACTQHKVAIAEGIGSPIAPAELTWSLIMNTVRQVPAAIEDFKNGKWQTNIGSTIYGKTIGIWGYGKIGKMVAGYAKAFGAKVLVWGSENSRINAVNDGFESAKSKEDFFRLADVVSLHLRLNDKTAGIVKETDLLLMKPTAALINTARAELIEEGTLLKCLKTGRPGFAGVDVYENEPIYDSNYELLQMKNVVCTPHLGYVEKSGYELYFAKAFENAINYINGNPTNIANPEVL
ncbi:D-2-hydroxyacid dehydrogenase family protein [Solitalea canadensis]|uniref:Phosphoglycerate dehydrogenase-like oxidoreductase n=1 Tax=Solitalea canadensis (strain ATCC 29591 / DSM 3403 / JCM 21819 / LMG 8368 / NBRC 15130 / NCIMB 12057 / USAM 9D) TaxID=929556 RepID=H8KNK9_SOLCM|nr:D-2-hydroxyacid dehydrogenase family protein [Solitalea canadensis]AFD08142.1 phosphoglycerate dehydrogenase-like oxidoreductase [Solitalea canadensis DSM 3403]